MKTTILSIAIMMGVATAATAQTWTTYADKSAKFKISLPAAPTITDNSGAANPSRTAKAEYGDYTNIINVYDLNPAFTGDAFTRAAEMIMAGIGQEAKLVSKSNLVINGKKGLRALFYIPSQQFYIDKGVVVDGKFSYSIMQIRSKQEDSGVADKMFGSINQ